MNELIEKRMMALQKRIMDMDRLADLAKHVIADVENDLSALNMALKGERELPLPDSVPSAKPAAAPLDADQELCICGHSRECHTAQADGSMCCDNVYCKCAAFEGTGKSHPG